MFFISMRICRLAAVKLLTYVVACCDAVFFDSELVYYMWSIHIEIDLKDFNSCVVLVVIITIIIIATIECLREALLGVIKYLAYF